MPYLPEAGDLIWTDFDPRIGREQGGRRPELVVSPAEFCRVNRIRDRLSDYLPRSPVWHQRRVAGGLPVSGEIVTSHMRSIDTLARRISYAGVAVHAANSRGGPRQLAALIGL